MGNKDIEKALKKCNAKSKQMKGKSKAKVNNAKS